MIEKRCAIYTRKSHEEGLDQEYNSLDAQRDACEAYIKSQAHEGWKLVRKHYDDGGFSGGSLDRPALQQLLDDVRDDKVDVIVVYKIDRLTRSLMDFSKIMDVLDSTEASFAAVTQQFNTTTSMGRLTLNVLLSFAQFEREVTGERIRDKIAASRKKGMWMGGARPTGYDISEKKLVVNESEANTIRFIFDKYIELGTAADVVDALNNKGYRNKSWVSPNGKKRGGQPFRAQGVCTILQNPLYIGKMRYRDEIYEGEHEAIIDEDLWDTVQEQLNRQRINRGPAKIKKEGRMLEGIIFDASGQPMTPTYSIKKGNHRYPYYVSGSLLGRRKRNDDSGTRIPAATIENLITDRIDTISSDTEFEEDDIKLITQRVTIFDDMVELELNHGMAGIDIQKLKKRGDEIAYGEATVLVRIRASLRKHNNKTSFITPNGYDALDIGMPDPVLVKNVGTAWKWRDMLDAGKYSSIPELCRKESQAEGYVRRILPLSFLAPDIVQSILDGHQPPSLNLKTFSTENIPLSWAEQRKLLGYAA